MVWGFGLEECIVEGLVSLVMGSTIFITFDY
jgi:hypothetical protein